MKKVDVITLKENMKEKDGMDNKNINDTSQQLFNT